MSKDEEIRNIHARRKNLLYLMQRYLNDNGFYGTAASLRNEAKLSDEYEVCDNIDLDGIYLEYASYYQLKFGKFPRILRKQQQQQNLKLELATTAAKGKKSKQQTITTPAAAEETAQIAKGIAVTAASSNNVDDLQVTVTKVVTQCRNEQLREKEKESLGETDTLDKQTLSCLQQVQHDCSLCNSELPLKCPEWQSLVDLVSSTIIRGDLKFKWSHICGNSDAVAIIKEAVVVPLNYPQLFNSGLKPWRSLLLHGPPGSGKTLLAKVLYAETKEKVTFFNVTASMVVSKWRGESEKLLKVLFHLALKRSPSVIFFDEIEALTSNRERATDHESSRRFKNELLQLMDGLEQSAAGLFILASSNLPWEIDPAFLRRFEKKVLTQLPNEVERAVLIGKLLPLNVKLGEQQMSSLVRLSEGFTGDEIRLACKEIAMQTVRNVIKPKLKGGESAADDAPVESAFTRIKPLSSHLMAKHLKWQKENGSNI